MRRRFVIAVQGLTESQEKNFRSFLDAHGFWWHWISNVWLFVTNEQDLTASQIRDAAKDASRVLVMEFPEDITWATRGATNAKGKNMSDWLNATWAKNE